LAPLKLLVHVRECVYTVRTAGYTSVVYLNFQSLAMVTGDYKCKGSCLTAVFLNRTRFNMMLLLS